MRYLRVTAFVAVLLVVASGCTLVQSANRFAAAPGTVSEPFWCSTTPGASLGVSDCQAFSAQLDLARFFAHAHFNASDATADGATSSSYVAGSGAAFHFTGPTSTFDPTLPDTLLYDGTDPTAQVAGMEWNVVSDAAPDGFVGGNDVWSDEGGGVWRLRTWILRPFQNEQDVFADTHPCLDSSGPIYDVSDPCYTSTHPNRLEILVSNDDGYNAAGLDAAVQALIARPDVHVTVSAPATNQSGSGGKTTPGGVTADARQTLSGYPAQAVNGFPADAVLYALNTMHVNPDLLVSGINDGQNIGPLIPISGTIGAARVGGRDSIPAVAVSQGFGSPPDFPSGVTALLDWIDEFLLGRAGPPLFQSVVNINVPTCTAGAIRGTVEVPAATALNGRPINPSNCLSTATNPVDDVDGFLNGYVTVSSIGT
jgi:5'-nucleotidase